MNYSGYKFQKSTSSVRLLFVFTIFLLINRIPLFAQDFHFSQFYNAPIITNAAHTGRMKTDYRFNFIHRSQWQVVTQPFSTSQIAIDFNIYKKLLGAKKFGLGVIVLNDQIGFIDGNSEKGEINVQNYLVSFANHYILDNESRHNLSVGLHAGLSRKFINTSGFIFRNQIDQNTNQANPNLPSGEDMNNNQRSNPQVNAGVYYDFYVSKKLELIAGVSGFNLYPQNEAIITGINSTTAIRYLINGGVTYKFTPKLSLTPQFMLQTQATTRSWLMGANVTYALLPPTAKSSANISLGGWYRLQDAAIGYAGFQYNHVQVGFSYDFTVSTFNNVWPVSKRYIQGGWELSLIYTGFLNRAIPNELTIPCKIF
ncbi:MAG: PorP/SprF family type IX secretion system membrane protein [Bacteroidota bacterium]|nr:PorP/SprF family type IX secretion system membrane protein [Bacteroidota bacterium]